MRVRVETSTVAFNRWFTRSLAVGAVASGCDWATAGTLLWLQTPTRLATIGGTTLGAVIGYFGNRYFAFRDHDTHDNGSLLRFVVVCSVSIAVHGQVVVWLTATGLIFAGAKLIADLVIFNVGQLFLLRRFVFPARAADPAP
jgi:putative flippase GtrA